MEEIKKTSAILRRLYFLFWILGLFMLGLSLVQSDASGRLSGNFTFRYLMETLTILLTAGLIPLSLKRFAIALRKAEEIEVLGKALRFYLRKSVLRLLTLSVPLLMGCLCHCLCRQDGNIMSSTGLLCMVSVLIASLFCIPSEPRTRSDLKIP